MMKITPLKSSFKFGLIMGLGFCLYTTLMWLTNLDSTYLSNGQYFDIAIIILPIVIIFLAIKEANNLSQINVFQRIFIAISVGSISYLIYDPFLYVYHHYINPEWFSSVIALKENELKHAHVSENKILENINTMKNSDVAQADLFRLSSLVPSVLIIPTLIALFSLIFIKVKKN